MTSSGPRGKLLAATFNTITLQTEYYVTGMILPELTSGGEAMARPGPAGSSSNCRVWIPSALGFSLCVCLSKLKTQRQDSMGSSPWSLELPFVLRGTPRLTQDKGAGQVWAIPAGLCCQPSTSPGMLLLSPSCQQRTQVALVFARTSSPPHLSRRFPKESPSL